VDEKYVKLNGTFHYVFSAVDGVSGIPLLVDYFQYKTAQSWQAFFTVFKMHYGTPNLIVSDGCLSLKAGRLAVFPEVKYQYCKFHKIRNLTKKVFRYETDPQKAKKLIKKIKQVFSRKTSGGRRKALLELEMMLPTEMKGYFKERIKDVWLHLTKSLTSNAAERWNRKIKKVLSGRYGLKSPETIKQLVYCLWFKELVIKGRKHLAPDSLIKNIKITTICQEMTQNYKMERLMILQKPPNAI
jgi:transposase-like protein